MEPISSTGRRESVLNVRNVMSDPYDPSGYKEAELRMSDLERIEEKHWESPVRGADDTRYCYEDDLPYPCDVVKLARALEALLKAHEDMIEGEFGTGRPDDRYHENWPEVLMAERVLREVAGE